MDTISVRCRSEIMALIRSKDTQPEIAVRKLVSAMGLRYRLHVSDLPGRPDLVFRRIRKIVFVHGCFWHQHARCRVARLPRSRLAYWRPKLDGNRKRDQRNVRRLREAGWKVLTIRECELNEIDVVARRLKTFLKGPLNLTTSNLRLRRVHG